MAVVEDSDGSEAIEAAWPHAGTFVKRTLSGGVLLAGIAGVVTLLCINALARGGAAAEGWVVALLVVTLFSHLIGMLICHAGFFRDLLALDGIRESADPDRKILERGFARVVNAPRYWFVRSISWFVIAAFNLSLARHWVDPDAFPWLHVFVRTTGSVAGAFLFGSLLFFYLKREFAPLRSALGEAIGDAAEARSHVEPVGIRTKVIVGVAGALIVATLYGAVMAEVRSERTAERTAIAMAERVLAEVATGAEPQALENQARRFGVLDRIVMLDGSDEDSLGTLDPWLSGFEIDAIRSSPSSGNSLHVESGHHFIWRSLPDGRVAVALSPAELMAVHVSPMTGALGIFLGVVLLVTLAVAWLLASDIERAVHYLCAEVARIASGDLRTGQSLLWEDELGDLASQIDDMADSLAAMITGVRNTADGVEAAASGVSEASVRLLETSREQIHGNEALRNAILGVTGPVQGIGGSAAELTASVEEGSSSILQMRGAGKQLDENASVLLEKVDEVSSSVDELIHSVRDVLDHAENLSGAAVDTSSSMEEMAASLREMDANAVETARLSEEVVEQAEDGREKVRQTLTGMERIRKATQAAQSVIRGLGGRTQEIGAIVNVIDDVAEETNLLALNAAIIAAQAGENGRAFSVVADEIKKLADRVLSSTKEIEGVIRSVQEEASNAVDAIAEGSRAVGQGVQQADQAGAALEVITASARDSGGRIGEIVGAVTEQTKAASHVVSLMESVRAGVDHIRRAGQEQDRGNEAMLASTEVMREIARQVQGTTSEQAQGAGRIADGVAAVGAAVERINAFLSEQTGACERAESEVARAETRTGEHGDVAGQLDEAVGRMRENADGLRGAVGRFRV